MLPGSKEKSKKKKPSRQVAALLYLLLPMTIHIYDDRFFLGISVIPIVGPSVIGITDCLPDPNRYVIPIPIPIPILSFLQKAYSV